MIHLSALVIIQYDKLLRCCHCKRGNTVNNLTNSQAVLKVQKPEALIIL